MSNAFRRPSLAWLAAATTLTLAACGADSLNGSPVGAQSGGTPVVGGICNAASATNTCLGQQVLACTPAGTWVVHETCGLGQKCQQTTGADGAATATCTGGTAADATSGDAGFDAGSEWDVGSGTDDVGIGADAVLADSIVDDTGASTGDVIAPPACTTYQDVQAIFLNNCNGCHNHKFGDACNLAANYPLINQRVQNDSMPPGGGLSASDKALIAAWAAGHNTCTPDKCPGADAGVWDVGPQPDASIDDTVGPGPDAIDDTVTIPDSVAGDTSGPACLGFNTVKPVFANNCSGGGCHSFQNTCPAPGGKFGSTAINNAVQAGSMPPGGGLSAGDQATIAAWVQGGAVCNCPTGGPDAGSTDTVGPGPDATDAGPGPDVGPGPDGGTTPPPATCGNLQCDAGETDANCPSDCGTVNQCILANCGQQANTCVKNSNACHQAFACQQACAAGDTACLQQCLAGKSNKTKNNLNALNTCITNAQCTSGGVTPPTGNVCDNACGKQGGTVNGQACYCDTLCAQYGDCCNAAANGVGATCAGSTCTQCNGGVSPLPTCGNGTCDTGETTANCPADCPPAPPVCGNGVCENGETTANCPGDCPAKTCTTYADVQTIFQQNCNGCHGHQFGNNCAAAANYTTINSWVQSGQMPVNGTLSAADKAKIAAWAAAKNACTLASCP